ncbi:hypothetical protein L195_g005417 [Trifolium pratense]|uniref:Uncharacterized protein n=1 Tax=Trifolium pratense TaxID=57577 RepID=A0A2K3P0R8_TRIPR|nr:hypothetical protein L195_g005417 [Trifolium pratense]
MEVMARLLTAGSFSQTAADDSARQKSAAEYIYRQLREADEANLLSEEDMHVYGERPMTDPLKLVCCNNCKKPVKDSQFAAHTVAERRSSEFVGNVDTAMSQSHLNGQIRGTPCSTKVKDAASKLDDTGINCGNRVLQASVMHPPTKRHKLTASTHLDVLEGHRTESGVTKTVSLTDGITGKDLVEKTVSEHGDPVHQNVGQVHMQQQHVMTNDFPAPLATKIYYSQRTNRLRAAIRHMYFENLSEELCTDGAGQKTSSHGEMVALQDSSQEDPSFEQMNNVPNKESHSAMTYSTQKSDHILAKSSEVCLLKAGGAPSGGLSNQFILDNVPRSAATNVGLTKGNFLPKAYSFASNTGNPLGTMQQTNGSVPVV